MNCLRCNSPLPRHNHGSVHVRCAEGSKAVEVVRTDAESILSRRVREEHDLLPWERHPIPWDNVRVVAPSWQAEDGAGGARVERQREAAAVDGWRDG